jgi:hypothetical protein
MDEGRGAKRDGGLREAAEASLGTCLVERIFLASPRGWPGR